MAKMREKKKERTLGPEPLGKDLVLCVLPFECGKTPQEKKKSAGAFHFLH